MSVSLALRSVVMMSLTGTTAPESRLVLDALTSPSSLSVLGGVATRTSGMKRDYTFRRVSSSGFGSRRAFCCCPSPLKRMFSTEAPLLGTISYQRGEYDQAEKYFRPALEHDDDAFEPTVNLSGTLLSMTDGNEPFLPRGSPKGSRLSEQSQATRPVPFLKSSVRASRDIRGTRQARRSDQRAGGHFETPPRLRDGRTHPRVDREAESRFADREFLCAINTDADRELTSRHEEAFRYNQFAVLDHPESALANSPPTPRSTID